MNHSENRIDEHGTHFRENSNVKHFVEDYKSQQDLQFIIDMEEGGYAPDDGSNAIRRLNAVTRKWETRIHAKSQRTFPLVHNHNVHPPQLTRTDSFCDYAASSQGALHSPPMPPEFQLHPEP